MVLKLTGKFPEQPVPQSQIEAAVEWLSVGVSRHWPGGVRRWHGVRVSPAGE